MRPLDDETIWAVLSHPMASGTVGVLRTGAEARPGSTTAARAPAASPGPVSASSQQRLRIVDAALACIARFGLAKTTLDDVARQARCSRATLYRAFPGGKEALLQAVIDTEVSRLFSELAVAMGEGADLEQVLVVGMSGAAERIGRHAALSFLLANEPEVVLPHLAFEHHDRLMEVVGAYAAPFLGGGSTMIMLSGWPSGPPGSFSHTWFVPPKIWTWPTPTTFEAWCAGSCCPASRRCRRCRLLRTGPKSHLPAHSSNCPAPPPDRTDPSPARENRDDRPDAFDRGDHRTG